MDTTGLAHPLVLQQHFTRREFRRGVRDLTPEKAKARPGSLNAIGWSVGHLAWQKLPQFVGNIDDEAPYLPETGSR